MVIGTLLSIRRYPVKSLQGEALERAVVETSGILGDRARALFVRSGHARTGKTYRGKEHDRLHLATGTEPARAVASSAGIDLEERTGEHFFDEAPISIVFDVWFRELSAHAGYDVEPERFRPNFVVRAAGGFAAEERSLQGAALTVGAVGLRVRSPIQRCITTTYDPRGGTSDPRILRFIARERAGRFGIYCDVTHAGVTCVGDPIVLHETSPG